MGSDFLTESGSGSNESIHGLKFGQKIYFEDAAASGAPNKAAGPGSSSSGSGRKVRGGGGGGVGQSGQPPRCQVEGCHMDLSDAKTYYSRHKVCGMHSKSPMVTVAGLQQRFCQQCSRFHQLPEFDQGKRSCRRRLVGHNERRRKPPPGSLLATRSGRASSSLSDNRSRGGGFLVDFSAYSRHGGRDAWPMSRSSERVPANQTTATGRHHVAQPSPWQNQPENPPASEIFLQGSVSGAHFPSGECFTGVADSSCALSLLSNQSWGSSSRNQPPALGVLAHTQGVSMNQPTAAAVDQYPNVPWDGFTGEMHPDLGLGSVTEPVVNSQFAGGVELSQQSRGSHSHMEMEHSRDDYGTSAEQMHWSL